MPPVAGISASDGNLHLPDSSRLAHPDHGRKLPPSRRVVFLDRDGVINEDIGFLSDQEQFNFLPSVSSAIRRLQEHFYIVLITNQSGIARGYFTENQLFQVHRHLVVHLEQDRAFLDAIYYCPHYPEGSVKHYSTVCKCRKPEPGMLLRAQKDWDLDMTGAHMVGDQPRDVAAAKNAGATGILVGINSQGSDGEHLTALDLPAAADLILERSGIP